MVKRLPGGPIYPYAANKNAIFNRTSSGGSSPCAAYSLALPNSAADRGSIPTLSQRRPRLVGVLPIVVRGCTMVEREPAAR